VRLPKVACAVNSSTGRASKSPGFPSPRPPRTGGGVSPCRAASRAHIASLNIADIGPEKAPLRLPPQPNSPPDTVIRAAGPDQKTEACFCPCTTTHVRRAASRAQVTASGMTGPGGPHRRASVARGHDAVLSLRYRSERIPERTAPASLGPCPLGPRNGLSESSSIARLPPARDRQRRYRTTS